MTRERLRFLPLEELKRLAESQNLEFEADVDKESLITVVLEVFEEIEQEREEANNFQIRVEAKKYRASEDDELPAGEYPPIPEVYNETTLVAMVRDPSWAFAYWEIEEDRLRQLRKDREATRLLLRVHDIEGVRFNGKNSRSSFDIPLKLTDSRWYINLPVAGRSYVLDLVWKRKTKEQVLARSNVFRTPREVPVLPEQNGAPINGDEILKMSLYDAVREIPGSGTIPQRIISVGN